MTAAGCSSDDSGGEPESGGEAAESGTPVCSDVWVDGGTLPEDYAGCENADGSIEAAATIKCDSGIGAFTTYQDEFFALLGGEITEAPSTSEEYSAAYEECFADG